MIKTTKILLLVVSLGLIGYDFIPFLNPTRGDTISEVICYYGLRCLTLPFVLGTLMGHFFLPTKEKAKQYPEILLALLGLSVSMDITFHLLNQNYMFTLPIIPLLLGVPIGGIFWQQNRS